jgi:hypothetical protein
MGEPLTEEAEFQPQMDTDPPSRGYGAAGGRGFLTEETKITEEAGK